MKVFLVDEWICMFTGHLTIKVPWKNNPGYGKISRTNKGA